MVENINPFQVYDDLQLFISSQKNLAALQAKMNGNSDKKTQEIIATSFLEITHFFTNIITIHDYLKPILPKFLMAQNVIVSQHQSEIGEAPIPDQYIVKETQGKTTQAIKQNQDAQPAEQLVSNDSIITFDDGNEEPTLENPINENIASGISFYDKFISLQNQVILQDEHPTFKVLHQELIAVLKQDDDMETVLGKIALIESQRQSNLSILYSNIIQISQEQVEMFLEKQKQQLEALKITHLNLGDIAIAKTIMNQLNQLSQLEGLQPSIAKTIQSTYIHAKITLNRKIAVAYSIVSYTLNKEIDQFSQDFDQSFLEVYFKFLKKIETMDISNQITVSIQKWKKSFASKIKEIFTEDINGYFNVLSFLLTIQLMQKVKEHNYAELMSVLKANFDEDKLNNMKELESPAYVAELDNLIKGKKYDEIQNDLNISILLQSLDNKFDNFEVITNIKVKSDQVVTSLFQELNHQWIDLELVVTDQNVRSEFKQLHYDIVKKQDQHQMEIIKIIFGLIVTNITGKIFKILVQIKEDDSNKLEAFALIKDILDDKQYDQFFQDFKEISVTAESQYYNQDIKAEILENYCLYKVQTISKLLKNKEFSKAIASLRYVEELINEFQLDDEEFKDQITYLKIEIPKQLKLNFDSFKTHSILQYCIYSPKRFYDNINEKDRFRKEIAPIILDKFKKYYDECEHAWLDESEIAMFELPYYLFSSVNSLRKQKGFKEVKVEDDLKKLLWPTLLIV